jgi:hypothetical protein
VVTTGTVPASAVTAVTVTRTAGVVHLTVETVGAETGEVTAPTAVVARGVTGELLGLWHDAY